MLDINNTKINILGAEYEILVQSEADNPKLKESVGLCEHYSKKIILSSMEETKTDVMCVDNLLEFEKKVLRREIIHAFLGESGLRGCSDWAENEEMVDFFAIQAPKIVKVFEELGIS